VAVEEDLELHSGEATALARVEGAGRDRSEKRTSRRLKESGEEWEGLVDGVERQLGERTTASGGVRHEGWGVGEDRRVRHQAAVRK
jgi:hypothetical protein